MANTTSIPVNERPAPEYTGWVDECMSWKSTCYVGDWAFLTKVLVHGPDALRLFSDLSVNGMSNFAVGHAKHCIQCDSSGKVMCEGVLMRLEPDRLCYQGGSMVYWSAYNIVKGGYNASFEFANWFNFQVSGPRALYLLEHIAGESLRDIGFMHFRDITIAG